MKQQQDKVARFLRAVAQDTRPPRPLPAAGQIWWRAQIIRRLTEKEKEVARVLRPLRWAERAVLALCGVGAVFLVSWLTLHAAQADAEEPWRLLLTVATGAPLLGLVACWFLWREAG